VSSTVADAHGSATALGARPDRVQHELAAARLARRIARLYRAKANAMTNVDLPPGLQLDAATAEFIAGVTSMSIATRDAQLQPAIGKPLGCLVSGDRRRVTVLIDSRRSARVVADVAAGSPLAVVFSLPATHRTVQIKSERGALAAATPTQQVRARMHCDAIIEHLVALGYGEAALRAMFGYDPADLLALRFAPTAVFAQTPGPRAGERIGG
jgi:hypothetical protein